MEQCEENSQENDDVIIEKEISKLIEEQRLFTESIYACLPVGIEIYDAHGVLRSINDHALRMYGVDDRTSVVNIVNLYKSPFVDSELLARIQSGEDISLEFEYDFDRVENPGSTAYLEFSFPHDRNYDTITPDRFEIYVNNSYTYSWMN